MWLYLRGCDLPYVRGVTYRLHPTFPQPERFVARTPANPNCSLELWTWGVFEVEAIVDTKDGEQLSLTRSMSYDRELRTARADDFKKE